MNEQQPTQGRAVTQLLQCNAGKLVTYKELMDVSGIDTRKRLQTVIKILVEREQLPIRIVRRDGYIYRC